MVSVKLFGALRLRSGLKEYQLEARNLTELFSQLAELSAHTGMEQITVRELRSCIISINGKQCGPRHALRDGDAVVLLTPASGG